GRDPQGGRGQGDHDPPRLRPEGRGLHPAAVPAILHDVVRQLSRRTGADRTRGRPPLPSAHRMSTTTLTLKERPHVPLESELLSPDVIAPLGHDEVRALPVVLGKRQRRLDDFFEVEGPGSEDVVIRGDAGRVKWIGRGMTRGRITVLGNAGMHLGAYMKGGTIDVSGDASDWVGAEMAGGLIHVRGSAGGQAGATHPGRQSRM